ncbi:mitochondrial potassium channel ATP-binding subunit [Pyrgilauda ruficollis]|uniref:mitochondrial potassium channel ATP-binding subunit n=1 Tax=Pyrgilauda ruficollis TaxID=221976 RepID=UPI001B85C97F|nr:mitochondrial potassium channel ATP-binding subunit [Pyrgilauda ruficollis]
MPLPVLLLRAAGAWTRLRPPSVAGRSFRYGGRLGLAVPPRLPPALPAPRRLLLAGSATGCVLLGLLRTAARCQEATVPAGPPAAPEPPETPPETPFDWPLFWTFLRPQLLALSAAVVLALGAALLNVRIPVLLGQLVDVVARCARGHVATYLREVRRPALRLLAVYCLQGLLTFGYIALLARVGERVAGNMRKALFSALLRQEVAFFDATRTGQLVTRLTADIQEFKSSFKLAISQGLRSGTQTAGCFVSLYLLSPKLTALLLVALPALVAAGAFIGAFLRSLSRQAQEQVAKATVVADEALGNVRTVRAFAMEEQQAGLFRAEVDRAGCLSERLGLGIAAFQGLSNLALNGIVLGTIFVGGSLMAGDELSPGDLMSFLVASQTVQRSLASISILMGQVVRGLSAGARVFELLRLEPLVPLQGGATIPAHSLLGHICFDHVSFSYPTRPGYPVLQDFSLTLPPCQTVAIVGPSGGGTSTPHPLPGCRYQYPPASPWAHPPAPQSSAQCAQCMPGCAAAGAEPGAGPGLELGSGLGLDPGPGSGGGDRGWNRDRIRDQGSNRDRDRSRDRGWSRDGGCAAPPAAPRHRPGSSGSGSPGAAMG